MPLPSKPASEPESGSAHVESAHGAALDFPTSPNHQAVQDVNGEVHQSVDGEIFLDPKPHVEQLERFLKEQNFEEGVPEAERVYEQIRQWCAEDEDNTDKYLALMEVVRLGWGMQYLRVQGTAEDAAKHCDPERWKTRAQEVCDAMHERQNQIRKRHGKDHDIRCQVAAAELNFFLLRAQMAWKKIYEEGMQGKISKEECAREAENLCAQQAKYARDFLEPGIAATDDDRELAGRLTKDVKFQELLALGHRMRGNFLEGSYLWHPDWEMRDADLAEKVLHHNPEYARSVQHEALAELRTCVQFYEKHTEVDTEVERPRPILYAYMEIVRHSKIAGNYKEALHYAERLLPAFASGADAITLSRFKNLTGEIQIIFAQKLLAQQPKDEGQAITLLAQGRRNCLEALAVDDPAQKRVAQQSLLDASNTMLSANIEKKVDNEIVPKGKGGFARRAYEGVTTELMQVDDDTWFFFEAPALAELYGYANRSGGASDIFAKVPRGHFQAAVREIEAELGHRRPKVPKQYYEELEKKLHYLHNLNLYAAT